MITVVDSKEWISCLLNFPTVVTGVVYSKDNNWLTATDSCLQSPPESESGSTRPPAKSWSTNILVWSAPRNIKPIIMLHSLWSIYLCSTQTIQFYTYLPTLKAGRISNTMNITNSPRGIAWGEKIAIPQVFQSFPLRVVPWDDGNCWVNFGRSSIDICPIRPNISPRCGWVGFKR